ncbi:recombinase family protein [Clostridium sp. MCC353]|uniref:recombinase family protein n=1 Tax=Clostridium sp. MCC353 TaxID=2592646 RepID=UPI001C02CD0E|nr:recombinase family protein [Clostridium sp. MCC353]MBT9778810.1 recombinase family protein [Clostridium sp. MCC353]
MPDNLSQLLDGIPASAPSSTLEIASAYIRVSTDDQTELSPDAQLREILKTAKADGYVIPKEFIFIEDKGRSGRRADNRPEFQRMISTAKMQPSPFKRLYLWKFSRFARNQDESTFYKGILRKKCGIEIISVSEPIAQGMFGRLIETIIEWFDEYYSYNLSGEVVRGMTEKALRQGYQTTPCLGYDSAGEGKPFIINEETYAIVEFIQQSYHNGMDLTSIARAANARGYRTRRGNKFTLRTVRGIISNPFYKGTVSWNGISFQGNHETRESVTSIFEDNQERMKHEFKPQGRRQVSSCRHWASGLLKCSVCGASLGYCRSNDPKRRPDYFQCWKYSKGAHETSCSISVSRAEAAIMASLRSVLETGELEFEYEEKKDPETLDRQALLSEALARIDIKEERIKDAYENGIDTLEEYKNNKLRLRAERDRIIAEAATLEKEEDQDSGPSKQEVLSRIQNVYDLLSDPNVDYEIKGNSLRHIIKQIDFDRKNNAFHFHYYV